MKTSKELLYCVLGIMLIYSCTEAKPTVEDFRSRLDLQIILESNGDLSLDEITQTNSFENEIFGQRTYTIKYSAKIKVEKDCYLFVDPTGMGPYYFDGFSTFNDPSSKMTPSPLIQILTCNKGDKLDYKSSTTYLMTENGWKYQ